MNLRLHAESRRSAPHRRHRGLAHLALMATLAVATALAPASADAEGRSKRPAPGAVAAATDFAVRDDRPNAEARLFHDETGYPISILKRMRSVFAVFKKEEKDSAEPAAQEEAA